MANTPKETTLPGVLFQYRPPEGWAYENLCRRVLYCGSSLKFNDPYDCAHAPSIRDLPDYPGAGYDPRFLQFCRLARGILKLRPLENPSNPSGAELVDGINEVYGVLHTRMRKAYGVACFSRRNDSLPMWAHYGGRGEGFCLAFGTGDKELPAADKAARIVKVAYSDTFPNADISQMRIDALLEDYMANSFSHKSKKWEYEDEWRLIRKPVGEVVYSKETLKGVYCGNNATPRTIATIINIVKETNPNAEVWKGTLSKSEYAVEHKERVA